MKGLRRTRSRWIPLLAVFVVAAARLPVLLAHQDTHYPFEMFSGNVAVALLDGLGLDYSRLTIIPHIRGGPLFGLFLAPLYSLLGSSTLVMKLVPWIWHALTAGLLVALLGRVAGRSAAWVGLGLLACAPPLLAKLSVLGLASHLEASLPAALAMLLWLPLARGRRDGFRAWLLFGLACGVSLFFHLQALLLCMILLGLTVLTRPRRLLSASLPLLLGMALGAWPTLLFDGGDLSLSQSVLSKTPNQSAAMRLVGPGGELALFGREAKANSLLRDGVAPLLEFGEIEGPVGHRLAYLYGYALALAAAWGAWRSRAAFVQLVRRPFRLGAPRPDIGLALTLHALVVGGLFVLSGMQLNTWFVGSGMSNRRLAPMLLSLLLLAALGLARRRGTGRRPVLGWVLLSVLLLIGAVGSVAAARGSEASRLAHRGEDQEWFTKQLVAHAGGDGPTLLLTMRSIDRGDRRFASLRFNFRVFDMLSEVPLETATESARAARPGPEAPVFAFTELGRAWGRDRRLPQMLQDDAGLSRLAPWERSALLHGVGMGLTSRLPRPSASESPGELQPLLAQLADALDGELESLVFEGLGFARGRGFEPYNHYLRRELDELLLLAPAPRRALLRGFGWGLRQRYLEPPLRVPQGLHIAALIQGADAEAFRDGYLGRSLPIESARQVSSATR